MQKFIAIAYLYPAYLVRQQLIYAILWTAQAIMGFICRHTHNNIYTYIDRIILTINVYFTAKHTRAHNIYIIFTMIAITTIKLYQMKHREHYYANIMDAIWLGGGFGIVTYINFLS